MPLQRARERPAVDPQAERHRRLRLPRLTLSQTWIVLAIALPTIVVLGLSLSSVDLSYHIRAGTTMLHTHQVIRTDTYSFTAFGRPWLDQQWGSQILLALLYKLGGWSLLVFVRALAGAVVLMLVFLACRAKGATMKQGAWLTLGSGAVVVGGLMARPQLFGLLLFALTVWILSSRDRRPALMFLVPVIVALWANLHGSFFLGALLAGLAFLEDRRRRSPLTRRTALVAALSLAAPVLNPFGFRVWGYAVDISTSATIRRTITEWRPPSVRDLVGALFFASVVAVVVLLARSSRRLPWTSLFHMAVFLVIALFAVRGVWWWAIAVPPLLVDALPERKDSTATVGDPLLNVAIVGIVAVLAIAFLPWWRGGGGGASGASMGDAPARLTTALERTMPPNQRLFNPQRLGSWLEFAVPRDRVFVDSRIEVYPDSVWQQYFAVSLGRGDWRAILDRWDVDVVIASRRDQAWLIPQIQRDMGWREFFRGSGYLAFERVT